MGVTKRRFETIYLDPGKLELLKQLAARTRIPRAVLAREAIDDLLVKHNMLDGNDAETRAAARSTPQDKQPSQASTTAETPSATSSKLEEELHVSDGTGAEPPGSNIDGAAATTEPIPGAATKQTDRLHVAGVNTSEPLAEKSDAPPRPEFMGYREASVRAEASRERRRAQIKAERQARPNVKRQPITAARKATIQAEIATLFAKARPVDFFYDRVTRLYELRVGDGGSHFARNDAGVQPEYRRIANVSSWRRNMLSPLERKRRISALHPDKLRRAPTAAELTDFVALTNCRTKAPDE